MTTALPLLLAAAAAQDPAALHPADAVVVAQVPDVQALRRAYERTAYAGVLADEELQSSLARLTGREVFDPLAELEAELERAARRDPQTAVVLSLLEDAYENLSAASVSVSVKGGDLAALLAAGEASSMEGTPENVFLGENLSVRLVLDMGDAEAAARMLGVVEGMMAEGGVPHTAREADGVRVLALDPPEGVPAGSIERTFRLARSGGSIVVTAGYGGLDAALGRLGGHEGPTAARRFARGREQFGAGGGTTVVELYMQPWLESVLLRQQPRALPVLDIVEGLAGPLASMFIRGGHWHIRIDESGMFVTDGLHARPQQNPLAGLLGAGTLTEDDLALVRPDAVVAWAVSLDADVLARLLDAYAAEVGGEDPLAQLDEQFGFRPDRDLLAPLGDAMAYSLPPMRSLFAAPPLTLYVELDDAEAFLKGMNGVFAMLEAEAGGQVQLSRKEYKDALIFSGRFSGGGGMSPMGGLPIDPAAFFQPTVAVLGDRVLVTTQDSHARREIRRLEKLADSGEKGLHEAITSGGVPEGVGELGYANWPEFFGKVYDGLKSMAPLLASQMGDEVPFDLTALPDAEVVTRHFEPGRRWKRIEEGGVRHHARSSLGPEAPLTILLGGAFLGMTTVRSTVPAPESVESALVEPVPEEAYDEGGSEHDTVVQSDATSDALLSVRTALTVYNVTNQGYPASLQDLLEGSEEFPNGYLDGGEVPKDGWGRALRYERTGDGFRLWSLGPDGVDQGGGGDDVTAD